MFKNILKIFIVLIIIFAQNQDHIYAKQSSVHPKIDTFIRDYVKELENTKIHYDGKKLTLYADPSIDGLIVWATIVGLVAAACIAFSISTPELAPMLVIATAIMLLIETFLLFYIKEKINIKNSNKPYITMDDTGINIFSKRICWSQVSTIVKNITTRYRDGWQSSESVNFDFYDRAASHLFVFTDNDDNLPIHITTLISIIYHYLTKTGVQFTESVNHTKIYTKTEYVYQPAYRRY